MGKCRPSGGVELAVSIPFDPSLSLLICSQRVSGT